MMRDTTALQQTENPGSFPAGAPSAPACLCCGHALYGHVVLLSEQTCLREEKQSNIVPIVLLGQ